MIPASLLTEAAEKLEVGDFINVLKITQFGKDKRIPAVIVEVLPTAIAVQALRGDFDDDGHDRMWLQISAKGVTWEP